VCNCRQHPTTEDGLARFSKAYGSEVFRPSRSPTKEYSTGRTIEVDLQRAFSRCDEPPHGVAWSKSRRTFATEAGTLERQRRGGEKSMPFGRARSGADPHSNRRTNRRSSFARQAPLIAQATESSGRLRQPS